MKQAFDDRFTYNNPALASTPITALTDSDLDAISPDFVDMAQQVRRHSVLLKRTGSIEIYQAITQDADPRIALRMAAAKDKRGQRLYPDLNAVKEALFGPPDNTSTVYLDLKNNILTQGLRRVSAALAASRLVGQLAQIKEQADHANVIEAQALADLARVLDSLDIVAEVDNTITSNPTFYFEASSFTIPTGESLIMQLFVPYGSYSGWTTVTTYGSTLTATTLNTRQLVADLADAINNNTLTNKQSNIIAAPVLSMANSLHKIDFEARLRDSVVAAEVLTVKFISTLTNVTNDVSTNIPFRWGVTPQSILEEPINSLLIAVIAGKFTSVAIARNDEETREPTILYFRRGPVDADGLPIDYTNTVITQTQLQTGKLRFRISPTMEEEVEINVPYSIGATPEEQQMLNAQRPSLVAEMLLQEMFKIKGDTRALGAIVRNDDPKSVDAMTALELIAFSITNPETWLILDVLEVPADIQLATGIPAGPLTSFSNKPRSIRVQSKFHAGRTTLGLSSTNLARPTLIKLPGSGLVNAINDKVMNNRYI